MPNRLQHSASPYLLQHANNPVDWLPWGGEALARAHAEDRPIFLSIGYSACHWCHVMAHESFEDHVIADLLNRRFVPVKVDREERPDLDETYMIATQLITGRGGWPNSLWLLPDGRPWYAGTYFPKDDRPGLIGFRSLLERLDDLWKHRRPEVEKQAAILTDAIRQHADATPSPAAAPEPATLAGHAIAQLQDGFDPVHGGFGEAPKFPPHGALALLLAEHRRAPDATLALLLTSTLDALVRGGIRDHLGGGFHRYATDAEWLVPHFEKMLYDNAQLAGTLAEAGARFSNPAYGAAAEETLDWVLREMTDEQGGFHAALDADSEGEEGRYYVWSHREILELLSPEAGPLFCAAYQIRPDGNYREEASGRPTGRNIPHLDGAIAPADVAALAPARLRLREARASRVAPGRDDKVITSWNGLLIEALARAGRLLSRPDFVAAAVRAADFLRGLAAQPEGLPRAWRRGVRSGPAFLEDYAALACSLFALHDATGQPQDRSAAVALAREMAHRFHDPAAGIFRSTAAEHGLQLAALCDVVDQALPSGSALALRAIRSAVEAGADDLAAVEAAATAALLPRVLRAPSACCTLILALRDAPRPAGGYGVRSSPPACEGDACARDGEASAAAGTL